VRNLEREIAKLARKAVTRIVKREETAVAVTDERLEPMLGVRRHRFGLAELEDQVGVVTGLAWTSVGGDLLQIEALKLPGKGRMKTTGKLGDVMKESIDAAQAMCAPSRRRSGSSRPSSRRSTSTSTSPTAPRPRTGLRRGWRW
jgi:ATP-dependent Lon protease